MQRLKYTCLLVFFLAGTAVRAQQQNLGYPEFLQKLAVDNLEYASVRYDIDIAKAEMEAAKAFPDPEISFAAHDNQQRRLKMGYGFEAGLAWQLELGGKRKARKNLAAEQLLLVELQVRNYFDNLRAEGSKAFFKAVFLRDDLLHLRQIKQLLSNIPLQKNNTSMEIARTDIQQKIEDRNGSLEETLRQLAEYVYAPEGETLITDGSLDDYLSQLKTEKTSDDIAVLVALQKSEVAEQQVQLARAERAPDIGVMLGVENNAFVKNIIGPSPGYTAVTAGISVPLKFSNKVEAATKTAYLQKEKAALDLRAARWRAEKAVAEHQKKITKLEQQLEAAIRKKEETEVLHESMKSNRFASNDSISLIENYAEAQSAVLRLQYEILCALTAGPRNTPTP